MINGVNSLAVMKLDVLITYNHPDLYSLSLPGRTGKDLSQQPKDAGGV